jgi:hypothetical protein
MVMKTSFAFTFFFFIVFSFLTSSSYAIMKELSTEELTKASDTVIVGEVESVEAQWSNDGESIFTSASVTVDKTMKGMHVPANIIVEYEGGEVGDVGLKISDQPTLMKGERVILFLKPGKSKKDGVVHNIVGESQGKYVIDANGIARKSGFSIAGSNAKIDNNIPVDKLIEKIMRVEQ